MSQLPATPSKFHYVFNMRDLSRIFAGLCQSQPSIFQTEANFLRLWRNEFTRVMCDRLMDEEVRPITNLISSHKVSSKTNRTEAKLETRWSGR